MEQFETRAKALAAEGKDRGQIELALVRDGLDQQSAESLALRYGVAGEADPAVSGASGDGATDMLIGAVCAIAGIGITMASYSSAAPGGRYTVTYGLVIYGIFRFVRGLGKS